MRVSQVNWNMTQLTLWGPTLFSAIQAADRQVVIKPCRQPGRARISWPAPEMALEDLGAVGHRRVDVGHEGLPVHLPGGGMDARLMGRPLRCALHISQFPETCS